MSGHVVMLLTNDFVSDPRVEKEATALSDAGYRVTVVAWDRAGVSPAEEMRGPIAIRRLGPVASHGGGGRNLLKYRAFWRLAAETAAALDPDVIHCHDSDTVPAGLKAIALLEAAGHEPKLVIDFHELYRESKMVARMGALGRIAVDRVERSGLRQASLAIVANPGTATHYEGIGGSGKLVVVENAPDLERFSSSPVERDPGRLRVCYIGQKRYVESLETLMRAIQPLSRVEAFLAGGGVGERAVAEIAVRYQRVTTEGRLAYEDIPARYEGCHAVYAVNDARVGNMRVNFPVKAMEGMALGLPVLVNEGTWVGDYVTSHGAGLAVDGEDPSSVTDALRTLADDPAAAAEMGRKGRELVVKGLNWEAAAGRLVAAYDALWGTDG